MSNPLFDMSPYQFEATQSYSPDWRDATGSDSAWDEPDSEHDLETSTHEPTGDAQDNSTKALTMAEEKTPESSHATVEVVEELSPEEEADRQRLELKVERAFYEAGVALRELRDRRLYRSTHRTFEEYCYERFGYTRRRPYQLIEAAIVFENLCTNGTQNLERDDLCTIGTQKNSFAADRQILPTSERQVRDLLKLEPAMQQEAWQQAVAAADGKVPSSRVVRGIVERLQEKPLSKATDFCQAGDVFILAKLEGAERKYNGCWAIAIAVNDFTVVVDVHDGTLAVRPDNLKPIDEPDARRQLPTILKRIRRLRDCGLLDRCAYTVLESLGRQTYLTPIEDKILHLLEKEYDQEDSV
jgi:hypothetical protein